MEGLLTFDEFNVVVSKLTWHKSADTNGAPSSMLKSFDSVQHNRAKKIAKKIKRKRQEKKAECADESDGTKV